MLTRNRFPRIALFIFCAAIFAGSLSAQPYFDVLNLHYITSPAKKLTGSNNPSDVNYFSAQAGLPLKMHDDIFVLNPFYEQYNLLLTSVAGKTQTLSSIGLPLTFLKQWKNKSWKTGFAFIPRLNADFKNIAAHDYQYGGAVLAIYKKKENLNYKFGLYYNSEFFGPFFIPLLGIDWKINDHVNLFGILPGNLELEYKFSPVLYGGINFKSITNSYRFDGISYLKISDNYLKLFLDYYLLKKIVITVEAGYSVLRKYKTGNSDIDNSAPDFVDGLLLKAGLSYRIRLNSND